VSWLLEANFLLLDLSQWHFRHEVIGKQLAAICTFNARNVLNARVDPLGLPRGAELRDLEEQIGITSEVYQENWDRNQSTEHEVRWLKDCGCPAADYLRALRALREEALIIIMAHSQEPQQVQGPA
jgi:hypothetical protein